MLLFSENNSYKDLTKVIITRIVQVAVEKAGNENIYPQVFEDDFEQKLQKALEKIITDDRVRECISEVSGGQEFFMYELNLKKYWMVLDQEAKDEVLRDNQFYMSRLYKPFTDKYPDENDSEAYYAAFHNYFKIPALLLYERYLRGFLPEFFANNIAVLYRVNKDEVVPVDNQFVIDNTFGLKLSMIKYRIADIIELKWVLLFVNDYNVSLWPVEPGTPSTN